MKKYGLLLIAFFVTITMYAQDKIYLRNPSAKQPYLNTKITEIGLDEIKYKDYDNLDGPMFTIEKNTIEKIVYANGKIERYDEELTNNAITIKEMRKNIIKTNIIALPLGYSNFSYERFLKKGQSVEGYLGLVGFTPIRFYNPEIYNVTKQKVFPKSAGAMLGVGYKFLFLPDFVTKGAKYRHVLQGSYAKPTFFIGAYKFNTYDVNYTGGSYTYQTYKNNMFSTAFIMQLGKQWVLSNRFSIDAYFGLGLGYKSRSSSNPNFGASDFVSLLNQAGWDYTYSSINLNGNPAGGATIASNSGIKIGYLFHTKKEKAIAESKK